MGQHVDIEIADSGIDRGGGWLARPDGARRLPGLPDRPRSDAAASTGHAARDIALHRRSHAHAAIHTSPAGRAFNRTADAHAHAHAAASAGRAHRRTLAFFRETPC